MQKLNDLSRSLAPLKPDGTLIAVIEMSQSSWLAVAGHEGLELANVVLKKLLFEMSGGTPWVSGTFWYQSLFAE
jgi:transposase